MDPRKHQPASPPPPTVVIDDTDEFPPSTGDASLTSSGPGFLSPAVTMPGEASTVDAAQGPPAPNPFSFQTQVISTSPVKSVRCDSYKTSPSAPLLLVARDRS